MTRASAHHRWLVALLALAFLLRVSGSLYDRGYGFHPDEHHFLDRAMTMMKRGTLDPAAYFHNPPLYTYAILLALYALFGVEYLTGRVGSVAEFLATLSPAVGHGLARGLSALAGTVTCGLLFLIGKRFGGARAGLLAAGLYAVAFLSVRDAHFAVNDIPMVALVTLAFGFALRLLDGGRPRDLVGGGLTAGLAAATKYNGGIALLPLLLACALGSPGGDGAARAGGMRGRIARKGLALLLLALAGFLLGNPYALFDPPAFLAGVTDQYGLRGQMWRGQSETPVPLLALQALAVELGWPLLLFLPLAAALGLRYGGPRAKAAGLALSVVLPLVLYHASHTLFFARFLLPCTPFLALIAAWGVVALRETPWAPWARRPVVLGAVVALLVASPFARSLYLDLLLQRPDTRLLAKAHLERVAPPGSVIVLEGNNYYPTYTPPLDAQRYRLFNLWSDPSLLQPAAATADFYLFSSFITGRVPGILEAEEVSLIAALERHGFSRISFSPLRGGGDLPFEVDQVYLPYRHLFRYERPGPTILIHSRPGRPVPPSPENLRGSGTPFEVGLRRTIEWYLEARPAHG